MTQSSSTPEDFSARLKAAREAKGLSQADLAERTGLQPSAVSHFETGRRAPSFDNLRILADALGVTTDFLLGRQRVEAPAGPTASQMFRDFSKLTAADQERIAEYAKMLARKKKGDG